MKEKPALLFMRSSTKGSLLAFTKNYWTEQETVKVNHRVMEE